MCVRTYVNIRPKAAVIVGSWETLLAEGLHVCYLSGNSVVYIKGDEEDGACGMYTGLCGTSEGKRQSEDRVIDEKIVLRHPDKIGFDGVIRINKDQDRDGRRPAVVYVELRRIR
jgi:hypothetical protein